MKSFHPLEPKLHDFDPSYFGSVDDLKSLYPNVDGWSAMMVACSEFAFQPDQNSIFRPGELYIIQNFGNVVLSDPNSASRTEINHMLISEQLRDVVVCGHLGCITVEHFLWEDRKNDWLRQGDELRNLMTTNYLELSEPERKNVAVQENVLLQLERAIRSIESEKLDARVYGWMAAGLNGGLISQFDPNTGQFE